MTDLNKNKMKFDEILSEIGEFGTYQKIIFTLLSFPCITVGSFCMMLIVILYTPEHRCKIPSLANDSFEVQSPFHESLINRSIPLSDDPLSPYDRCHIYQSDGISFSPENTTRIKCTEWVYDQSIFVNTFTSQIDLVCDDALKTSHIMMFFYFGLLVGDFILGMLSDLMGRKKSMYIALLILLASSIGVSFVSEFYSFTFLQFIIGGSGHGAYVAIAVISIEMVGPSKRLWTGMLVQAFFAIGVCYDALTAFLARRWMWINLTTAMPCVLYLSYWWLIPESSRWLISKGRKKEAMHIIRRTARFNQKDLKVEERDIKEDAVQHQASLRHVFTSPVLLRRSLILSFNWMIVSMTYYGVTMNAGNMGGSFFLNFFFMGLAEIPGIFAGMAILDRLGRRWSNAGSLIVGGLACIATIPTVLLGGDDLEGLTIALTLIGKAAATSAFSIIYIFTSELSPTVVRNAEMGLCSCAARVGAMLAPYIAKSGELIGGKFGRIEPLVVFGVVSIITGLLSLLLPETLNQTLPDTITEGEQFGRKIRPRETELATPIMGRGKDVPT